MNGFLPLIEGFLAFALTMLVLTTAVSAIVGVFHRLRRKRARGLRDMMRVLHTLEIQPLIEETEGQQDADTRRQERARFLVEMTLTPRPRITGESLAGEDPWQNEIDLLTAVEAPLPDDRLRRAVAFVLRWLGRWRSLRWSLDALTEEALVERLEASSAGKKLTGRPTWTGDLDRIRKRFASLGDAASEAFGRHSRAWSVVIGFVLAFAINIDSLDLLNSYLSDPTLRAQVIGQTEDVLRQARGNEAGGQQGNGKPAGGNELAGPPAAEGRLAEVEEQIRDRVENLTAGLEETATAAARRGLDELRARLEAALRLPGGQLQTATDTAVEDIEHLAGGLGDDLHLQLLERLENLRGLARLREGLRDAEQELAEARREVVGIARSLTDSFPIGWNRYPNCDHQTPGADPRCIAIAIKLREEVGEREPGEAAGDEGRLAALTGLPVRLVALVSDSDQDRLIETIGRVRSVDRTGFRKWLVGVLLTGIFLGLGTPFWIQVVNRMLALRRGLRPEKKE